MSSRILITGANGFIGKHLMQYLQHHTLAKLTGLQGRSDLDLTQPAACQQLPEGEICIHLAGAGNPTDFDRDATSAWQSNVTGTLNLLQALQDKGYKRCILASTYVYGRPDYTPVNEQHPVRPPHPYPRSKYICEQLLEEFTRRGSLTGVALRIFNVYGPEQALHMLIPTILNQLNQSEITLRDAVPKRDFVHVHDVVRAIHQALKVELQGFETVNIASGESISVGDLVNTIQRLAQNTIPVHYQQEPRPNEVNDVVGDIQKARELLQWQPEISLDRGLGELIACAS